MENDKKEKQSQRDQSETSRLDHDSSSLIFPDLGKLNKEFEKSMAGLEEIIKLLKSDIKILLPINIFNSNFLAD